MARSAFTSIYDPIYLSANAFRACHSFSFAVAAAQMRELLNRVYLACFVCPNGHLLHLVIRWKLHYRDGGV